MANEEINAWDHPKGKENFKLIREQTMVDALITSHTSKMVKCFVLAPIMFLIYVNDMVEKTASYGIQFGRDANFMRYAKNEYDYKLLQENLSKLYE